MKRDHKPINDNIPDVVIEVTSRLEAGDILSCPERCAEFIWLISIGAPEDELPVGGDFNEGQTEGDDKDTPDDGIRQST